MDTDRLEALISGGVETPNLDIKADMPWDKHKLVKDILALSNVRDGGAIVIGLEDGTFRRTGVGDAHRDTFNEEAMRDQISTYADPGVEFWTSFPKGRDDLTYVAIEVAPFREVPVICKKDGPDVYAGVIYYRTWSRRVESAAVRNSEDLRSILTIAASRLREGLQRSGFVPDRGTAVDDFGAALSNELGDL